MVCDNQCTQILECYQGGGNVRKSGLGAITTQPLHSDRGQSLAVFYHILDQLADVRWVNPLRVSDDKCGLGSVKQFFEPVADAASCAVSPCRLGEDKMQYLLGQGGKKPEA
jgi:hypothetical protein